MKQETHSFIFSFILGSVAVDVAPVVEMLHRGWEYTLDWDACPLQGTMQHTHSHTHVHI